MFALHHYSFIINTMVFGLVLLPFTYHKIQWFLGHVFQELFVLYHSMSVTGSVEKYH